MATPRAPDDLVVRHNEAEQRFETVLRGELSLCEYQLEGGRMIFTHTYVPPELRGLGVAQKLVRVALEYARDQQRQIVPACSYVAAFVERNPEFHSLVA